VIKNQEINGKGINYLILGAALVTLILTPIINGDSLIIPKLVLLFCIGMYLFPKILVSIRKYFSSLILKYLFIISILFVVQMTLVMVISSAPFEQEFYGRGGRSLGFATYFSLIVILLYSAAYSNFKSIQILNLGLSITCIITSLYSIAQYYGYDVFEWETRTNGIIGTLGNPNFQSSFAAMALIPTLVSFWKFKFRIVFTTLSTFILLFTIYISQSTQGYIAVVASFGVLTLLYLWYRNRLLFSISGITFGIFSLFILLGMRNLGPLSQYLYKTSVVSREEMWRTAFAAANDNPLFGVGLDSFGDVSLLYRDQKTANGVAEYADNAHNFFLQFALTGGYLLAILSLALIILTIVCLYKIQKSIGNFDRNTSALIACWICFQMQSLISPSNISMLTWNYIISGVLIGVASKSSILIQSQNGNSSNNNFVKPFSYLFLVFALIIVYPYFNADRVAFETTKTLDATAAVNAAKMYPESSVRYQRLGLALYNSKLYDLSLDVARSATKFNSNHLAGWFLILVNEQSPLEERKFAKLKILELDPFNKEVQQYKF